MWQAIKEVSHILILFVAIMAIAVIFSIFGSANTKYRNSIEGKKERKIELQKELEMIEIDIKYLESKEEE